MCEYSDDTGYKCPYEKIDDSDYCIFHLQDDNKNIHEFDKGIKDILDEEKDEDLINLNGFHFPSESFDFSGQVFQNKIDFYNVIFSGNANFGGAKFRDANFRKATFSGEADFRGTEFSENVDFWNAKFFGDVNLRGAKFRDANFRKATFSGDANFRDAEFSENADFKTTIFSGKANFRKANFKDAKFKDAKFSGFTNFIDADFSGEADFSGTEFSENVDFWDAKFSENVDFWNAEFFREAKFRYAKLRDVNFKKVTFSGDANFRNAIFSEDSNFRNAIFSGNVNFRDATFSGADFRETTFSGKTSFKDAKFSGNANFEEAELTGKFEFIPEISETIILENTHFSDNVRIKADMSKCSFAYSNIERVDMTDSVWIVENKPKDLYKIWEERQGELAPNWKKLEGIYRRLKQSCQKFGDTNPAGKFYYREMECKRKQLGGGKWLWYVGFKVLCGYGEKPENVILSSGIIIFFCSLGFFYNGIELLGSQVLHISPRLISYDISLDITWFKANFWNVIIDWIECLYTSVITFTTLGYGDVHPIGYSRIFASIEAGLGIFLTALFVFVFTRKMSR